MIRMYCPSIERVVVFDQLYPQLESVDVCMDARFFVWSDVAYGVGIEDMGDCLGRVYQLHILQPLPAPIQLMRPTPDVLLLGLLRAGGNPPIMIAILWQQGWWKGWHQFQEIFTCFSTHKLWTLEAVVPVLADATIVPHVQTQQKSSFNRLLKDFPGTGFCAFQTSTYYLLLWLTDRGVQLW